MKQALLLIFLIYIHLTKKVTKKGSTFDIYESAPAFSTSLKKIITDTDNTFKNIVNSANNYKINLINGTCYDILPMMLPFGVNTNPTIKDLEDFINSRCIPETRFDLKQMLKLFDIPAYDPWDTVKRNHGAA